MIESSMSDEKPRAWVKWSRRAAAAVLVALAVFIFGWVPWFLGGVATIHSFHYRDRENQGLTPGSFDDAYEDVAFRSADGVEIRGWWVPATDPHGTVVMAHGLNRSRIEMVRKVPFVHERGWNALLIDLRHHGESGGEATTLGVKESEDVLAAAAFARARGGSPVVLWGVSLGAASVMLAAARDPQIAGVICDSSYRSLKDTVVHHLKVLRGWRWWLRLVPVWPVADEVLFWMGERGDFDPAAANVLAAAAHLDGRPALFVANSDDWRMPRQIAFDLKAAAGPSAEVLVVPGHSHGGAWRDGTAAYESAAATLLAAARTEAGAARVAAR
jgi:alpha-beta hydrolase superfamily lysophospholipase